VRSTTHELVGVACTVAASRTLEFDAPETAAAVAGAVWGSWLPDADRLGARVHRRGRLARRNLAFAALAAVLRLPLATFALLARHRGVSHSLAACGLLAGLAAVLAAAVGGVGAAAAAGCALGYCAHVLADACTPSGVSPVVAVLATTGLAASSAASDTHGQPAGCAARDGRRDARRGRCRGLAAP
jgi:membrane-bound metal-dependent hydrolase YbcI (DUF457 family)